MKSEEIKQLVADFSSVPKYRELLAYCYHGLGNFLKDPGERERSYRQSLAIWEALADDPATRTAARSACIVRSRRTSAQASFVIRQLRDRRRSGFGAEGSACIASIPPISAPQNGT